MRSVASLFLSPPQSVADAVLDGVAETVSPQNTQNTWLAVLEAVLFIAREPHSGKKLAQLAELPAGVKVHTLLRQLNERYDQRQSAFRIVEVAGGFQLRSRPEFAPWLVRLQEIPVAVRLSSPVMETLVVIAYRQPVSRAGIERIRGVQCGEVIRQLLDRDLVRIAGRSEELGRPFLYGTTKTFLEVFGLGSLQELPELLFDCVDITADTVIQALQSQIAARQRNFQSFPTEKEHFLGFRSIFATNGKIHTVSLKF